MELRVLGSLTVSRNGEAVELGPQLRRVLAALLVRHGSVVSMDRLVEDVWEGEPSDGAHGSLRTYMTRLRRAVDPDGTGLIEYRDPGYVLTLGDYELDSELFESEIDEAAQLLRVADDEAAARVLAVALERWRGDAYAGFADELWARPEAVRLEERRFEAQEMLIEAQLGIGDTQRAVAEAQALAEAAPLRERPRNLLMRALYTSGRQADALREYREFRRLLVEEAGLDPSSELVELEGRIGRDDPTLTGAARVLRGYDLGEQIGQGAFAVVHRGVQPGIEREVAIKVFRSSLADRPEFVRRFENEARIVASVEHPHVVPLYDYWREPGAAYLVMRLMRGGNLEAALRARGPFSQAATADLLRDVGSALEAAHRRGVVHRDVRPANLLLDEDGAVYLADFGIALPTETTDDIVIASPAYAAPELLRGEQAGVTADVLSLGVTTFELLTGRLPFADSNTRADLIRRQLAEPLPAARATRTDLPARIDDVLARATAKAPDDRHPSVAALVEDLVDVLESRAWQGSGSRRTTADLSPGTVVENPYVGLHTFDEADADRFFGRSALVTELVESLSLRPFTVVVGPSGSGKSSVVRAGLVPALRRGAVPGSDRWYVTGMVPGVDAIDALEAALLRVAVNPPASLRDQLAEDGGLLRAVRRVLPDDDSVLLVVLDQFEELFTMSGTREQDRFLTELAHAITAEGSPLRVVATLRADHYDAPLRHTAFADVVTAGTVTVRPMTPAELERVIVQPARRVGVDVEPALVAELVAGVSARPAALPLLQFSLTEAFERRTADVMLAATHQATGGLVGAVAARADRIVDAGGAADEAATRRIFGRLVTLGEGVEDTRRRALRSEFGADERTAWLLDAFVGARLLTVGRDDATREPTVEVAHEALLRDWPRLRAWVAEDRDDLRTLRAIGVAASTWETSGRDEGELARGGRLETALELRDRRPELLNEVEAAWLDASAAAAAAAKEAEEEAAAHERRQNRRLRQLLGAAAALAVVAMVAAGSALVLRDRAVGAQEDAEIERLSAVSTAQVEESPDLAILLALEANRRRDDVGTQTALQQALGRQPQLVEIVPGAVGPTSVTVFSGNGSVGLAHANTEDGGIVRWFDPATGDSLGDELRTPSSIGRAAVSGDGSVAALALDDGTIQLVDVDGQEVGPPFLVTSELFGLALDRGGDVLAVRMNQGTEVVDVASGDVLTTFVDPDSVPSFFIGAPVALTADGGTLLVSFTRALEGPGAIRDRSTASGGVDVIDVATGQLLQQVEGTFVAALALSGRDQLVVGDEDGGLTVVDLRISTPPVQVADVAGDIAAVAVSVLGTTAAATFEGTVRLWDSDGTPLSGDVTIGGRPMSIVFDGETALVSVDGKGHVRIDPTGHVLVERIHPLEGIANNVNSDNPFVEATTANGATIQARRLADNTVANEWTFEELFPNGYGGDAFYSQDGTVGLTYSNSLQDPLQVFQPAGDTVFPFDLAGAYEDATGSALNEETRLTVRPSNDGERIFFSVLDLVDGGATAFWFASRTGDVLAGPLDLPTQGAPIVLPDERVVMGDNESAMFVLDADLSGPPAFVEGSEGLRGFDVDEVSGDVLVGSRSGDVALLDPETLELRVLQSATGSLTAGTFSPDGQRVAVLAEGGEVQLLDLATGRLVGRPMTLERVLTLTRSIHWATDEDGGGVWVGSYVGPVNFAADTAAWRRIACATIDRELTTEEWRTYVSPTEPQVPSCE